MAEEIKDLIEKINQEGIQAAEEKAREIEAMARQKADSLLAQAKVEAQNLIAEAKERIAREDEKERTLLAQAGRDFLLTLRKELSAMLERLVFSEIQKALSPDDLSRILTELIKSCAAGQDKDIVVSVSKDDWEGVQKSFLNRLREETKKGITLKPSEEISGGFTISFDGGKSCFDCTNKALAEYIGTYLKPKLNQILQEAAKT